MLATLNIIDFPFHEYTWKVNKTKFTKKKKHLVETNDMIDSLMSIMKWQVGWMSVLGSGHTSSLPRSRIHSRVLPGKKRRCSSFVAIITSQWCVIGHVDEDRGRTDSIPIPLPSTEGEVWCSGREKPSQLKRDLSINFVISRRYNWDKVLRVHNLSNRLKWDSQRSRISSFRTRRKSILNIWRLIPDIIIKVAERSVIEEKQNMLGKLKRSVHLEDIRTRKEW